MTDQPEVTTKPKATRAEVKRRVSKVTDLLASGVNRAGILQYVSDKTDWKLTDRQIDNYIQRATDSFKDTPGIDRVEQYKKAIRRMEMILSACLKVQDYARAIAASKELHTLMALYEPPARQTLKIEGLDLFSLFAEKYAAKGGNMEQLLAALLAEIGEDVP